MKERSTSSSTSVDQGSAGGLPASLDLLVIPMHDWRKSSEEGFRTRDGHLLQHFLRDGRVRRMLILGRPTSLPELALRRRTPWVRGRVLHRGLGTRMTYVHEKGVVLDIVSPEVVGPIRHRRSWTTLVFQKPRVRRLIQEAARRVLSPDYLVWLWNPLAFTSVPDGKRLVFDAIDDQASHPQMKRDWPSVRRGYEFVKNNADIIFTNSEVMARRLGGGRAKPLWVPNGVDVERFLDPAPPPPELARLEGPVFGYVGKIQERLDVEMVGRLAESLRSGHLVLVGPFLARGIRRRLAALPRTVLLGDRHYEDIPGIMSAFDVGIIPHRIDPFTTSMDPLKFYEYLAARLPVVTTPVAGTELFSEQVEIVGSAEEFVAACHRASVRGKADSIVSEQISRNASWALRADRMLTAVLDFVGREGLHAAL